MHSKAMLIGKETKFDDRGRKDDKAWQ